MEKKFKDEFECYKFFDNICYGEDIDEITWKMENQYGAEYEDEWMDDVIRPDREYLMCREFSIDGYYVRMYYSSIEEKVSDLNVVKA